MREALETEGRTRGPAGFAIIDCYALELSGAAQNHRGWHADLTVLSVEERARAETFEGSRRSEFVATRAALRRILANHLGLHPDEVPLGIGAHRRPRLRDGAVHFSVSHTRGLALIAICRDTEIGIDVERIRRVEQARPIAAAYFGQPEDESWMAGCDDAFLREWTRREALLKALDATGSMWSAAPRLRFECIGERVQLDGQWIGRARSLRPAPGFVGAIATRGMEFQVRHLENAG